MTTRTKNAQRLNFDNNVFGPYNHRYVTVSYTSCIPSRYTNFYISAQQFIAIILAIVGVFAGVGIGMAWVLYSTLYKKTR